MSLWGGTFGGQKFLLAVIITNRQLLQTHFLLECRHPLNILENKSEKGYGLFFKRVLFKTNLDIRTIRRHSIYMTSLL